MYAALDELDIDNSPCVTPQEKRAAKTLIKKERKFDVLRKKLFFNSKLFKLKEKDYSRVEPEFRYWLKEELEVAVSDLSNDKLMKQYKKFTTLWNKHKLPAKYYKGIDDSDWGSSLDASMATEMPESPEPSTSSTNMQMSTFTPPMSRLRRSKASLTGILRDAANRASLALRNEKKRETLLQGMCRSGKKTRLMTLV